MQDIVETEFSGQTVVSVMHRLRYVERFNRVLLLNQGRVVELDSPTTLLARNSEFRKLYMAMQSTD